MRRRESFKLTLAAKPHEYLPSMAGQLYTRRFTFDLPLFSNSCGPTSSWNRDVHEVMEAELGKKHLSATYEILVNSSKAKLSRMVDLREKWIAEGKQSTSEFRELEEAIEIRTRLISDGLGSDLFPQINVDYFSFPIFGVRRNGDSVVKTSIAMRPYQSCAFEPPWIPREKKCDGKEYIAHEVPAPQGTFRPAGPASSDSDGAMILYDDKMGIEYDFWQVSARVDSGHVSHGGGVPGVEIHTAGSVAMFDARGLGARHPEVDPNGSARASGLPYLGGLLLPEDLRDGANSKISHALALAIPQLRFLPESHADNPPNWVYPATLTERTNAIADPYVLAAGQRIALANTICDRSGNRMSTEDMLADESIPPVVRIFLAALFNYGAYLVDGADGFTLVAEDYRTAPSLLNEDQVLELTGADTLPDDQTFWEFIVNTLNEYLSHKLFEKSGLAFACFDEGQELHYNFDVVKDLEPFYHEK